MHAFHYPELPLSDSDTKCSNISVECKGDISVLHFLERFEDHQPQYKRGNNVANHNQPCYARLFEQRGDLFERLSETIELPAAPPFDPPVAVGVATPPL